MFSTRTYRSQPRALGSSHKTRRQRYEIVRNLASRPELSDFVCKALIRQSGFDIEFGEHVGGVTAGPGRGQTQIYDECPIFLEAAA